MNSYTNFHRLQGDLCYHELGDHTDQLLVLLFVYKHIYET